jgi:hypothetical protein
VYDSPANRFDAPMELMDEHGPEVNVTVWFVLSWLVNVMVLFVPTITVRAWGLKFRELLLPVVAGMLTLDVVGLEALDEHAVLEGTEPLRENT